MTALRLLDGAVEGIRGPVCQIMPDGNRLYRHRVYPKTGATFAGPVAILFRSKGDTEWQPTGVEFSDAADKFEYLTLDPGDQLSILPSVTDFGSVILITGNFMCLPPEPGALIGVLVDPEDNILTDPDGNDLAY